MDGIEKSAVGDEKVTAHMFEFTTQVSIDKNLNTKGLVCDDADQLKLVPCQTILLIKQKNAKKINSHKWFFEGICKVLDPEVCLLLDVGTKPRKRSFFHLYEAFRRNPKVGGACGEIVAQIGKSGAKLLNPLVAIQNFEYKMSNILDKPLESVFGYISVLPGAFSAYRFEAIQGEPLMKYFKGDHSDGEPEDISLQEANMYLAEDRILCFEVVMSKDNNWLLKYVKSASAETDVPPTLDELIAQRRRWLNGSFFAALHATINWMRIFQSKHTPIRKLLLCIEFTYNTINLIFTWFGLGNFYLALFYLFNITSNSTCYGAVDSPSIDPFYPNGQDVFTVLSDFYVAAMMAIFVASLGNRPQASKFLYTLIALIFAVIMFFILFMGIWTIKASIDDYYKNSSAGIGGFISYAQTEATFRDIVISMLSTYGLFVISAVLHLQPFHLITCGVQYLLMIPTFVNVLNVYAFCNLHDISWGTKGDNTESTAPAVVTQQKPDGTKVAVVEVPDDADMQWDYMHKQLETNSYTYSEREGAAGPDASTKKKDFYKNFRTKILLLWTFSNYVLVFVFTNEDIVYAMRPSKSASNQLNPYFTFLLWSVAAISFIRFLFSTIYLIGWSFEAFSMGGKRNPVQKAVRSLDIDHRKEGKGRGETKK